jgi:hypothetical protein
MVTSANIKEEVTIIAQPLYGAMIIGPLQKLRIQPMKIF